MKNSVGFISGQIKLKLARGGNCDWEFDQFIASTLWANYHMAMRAERKVEQKKPRFRKLAKFNRFHADAILASFAA